ncbi:hypothetical protein PAEPH01_1502 [Pancytospora epiphaga]|nr:hypothetical protein PAEPH01_1502 [Pancytospora epiphaga]
MVGVKHRYVILELFGMKGGSTGSSLRSWLWERMRQRHGEWGLGRIDRLDVCEYYTAMSIAVVRCDLKTCGLLCKIIREDFPNGDLAPRMGVISVSGILKKAKGRLLKRLGRQQVGTAQT